MDQEKIGFFLNDEVSLGASTFQGGTFHGASNFLCNNSYSRYSRVLKLNAARARREGKGREGKGREEESLKQEGEKQRPENWLETMSGKWMFLPGL